MTKKKREIRRVEPIRSEDDVLRLGDVLRVNFGPNYYTLYILGINSGLRISDLLALTVRDVWDFEANEPQKWYRQREQKTDKAKLFRWNEAARLVVAEYIRKEMRDARPDSLLFESRKKPGTSISRVQVWRVLKAAGKQVGLKEDIGTHTLRKTFGYHAWRRGTDVRLLQEVYNHSHPSTTLRYISVTQDEVDQVYINNPLGIRGLK